MTEPGAEIRSVTIGTAGHIDHGKTTLVRALVGGDPTVDRLKDERKRGMTIDIGYAEFMLLDGTEVGIVDVPGHERFIRNMVAGATGIDIVLLVVAADDGVMPQTREHLDIMALLGIGTGVVAITKHDLVDKDMFDLARDDVRSFLAGTFLESAPIHAVSGTTGEGVDALREALSRLVAEVPPRRHDGLFRLPVQRSFTAPGYGTVVTGIPLDGTLTIGDHVEVLPRRLKARVRGLQAYHHPVETAFAGHRTAVNLSDIDYRAVRRGDVLATPGLVNPVSLLSTKIRLLPSVSRPLLAGAKVRLHVGTNVVDGHLIPLAARAIRAGEETYAQIRTDHPIVAGPGDRFILRRPSPAATLGGGVILGTPQKRLKARRFATIRALKEREAGLTDPEMALEAMLRSRRLEPTGPDDVARELLVFADSARERLEALETAGRAVRPEGSARWFHPEAFEFAREALMESLRKVHAKAKLKDRVSLTDLRSVTRLPEETFEAVLKTLVTAGEVVRDSSGGIRAADHVVDLSPEQVARLETLERLILESPFAPPVAAELPHLLEALPDECRGLVDLLIQRDRLVRLNESIVLHRDALEEARNRISSHEKARSGLSAAEIRTLLDTSRKYVIPILEHLDAVGFTARQGDLRVLARS